MKHKLLNGKKEIIVKGIMFSADKDGIVDLPEEVRNQDCEPLVPGKAGIPGSGDLESKLLEEMRGLIEPGTLPDFKDLAKKIGVKAAILKDVWERNTPDPSPQN